MAKIEIEKEGFCKFLELSVLQGRIEITEALVKMESAQISTVAKDSNKIVCVSVVFKYPFAAWGELGVTNLPAFKKFISAAGEKVTLDRADNKLICQSGRTKYSGTLVNAKYMNQAETENKFRDLCKNSGGNEFTLKSVDIKKVLDYYKTINPKKFEIVGKGSTVTFKFEGLDSEVEADFDVVETFSEFKIKVSEAFIDFLFSLAGFDVVFSMKTGFPIYAKIASTNINCEYIFAPLAK